MRGVMPNAFNRQRKCNEKAGNGNDADALAVSTILRARSREEVKVNDGLTLDGTSCPMKTHLFLN